LKPWAVLAGLVLAAGGVLVLTTHELARWCLY
jgi:hypothetical protein